MAENAFTVGAFIVVDGSFGWHLLKITEVKKATLKATEEGSRFGYARTINKASCLFVGSKDTASALCERLTSSRALCNEERRKSNERREERDKRLIADAISTTRTDEVTV